MIKGSLNHGDHVITTFMEHNSVLRPLYEMERQGVCLTITSPDVGDIKQAITKDTKMIVMTHASNVTGEMFDIQSVGKLCREKGILFVVDTAQSAGVIPISMKEDNIDILCFTGHKGLMGPQGIGGICIRKGVEIRPLKQVEQESYHFRNTAKSAATGIGSRNIKWDRNRRTWGSD